MEAVKVLSQLKEVKNYLRTVFNHCISSVNPKTLVSNELLVQNGELIVRGINYKLMRNCYLVGFGKGVVDMAAAACVALEGHLQKGMLSIPEGTSHSLRGNIDVFEGAKNNIPDEKAEKAAKNIVKLVTSLSENDNLIIMITGGGSALLPYPIPPVTLKEKLELTNLLQKRGAPIVELNAVRRKLSLVKGGKLAKLAYPAQVISLILSDIVGDPLDSIASGPTVKDISSKYTSIEILKKYELFDKIPNSVIEVLTKEDPEDKEDYFINTRNYIIGNNSLALTAAKEMTVKDGYVTQVLTNSLQGKVETVSLLLAKFSSLICQALTKIVNKDTFLCEMEKLDTGLFISSDTVSELAEKLYSEPTNKLLLLFGGETSVEIKGNGKGGRNQELALRFSTAVDELAKTNHVLQLFNIVILCGGTDGLDGPTDAAGALGYIGQTQCAEDQGLHFTNHIANNDSYTFFSKLNNGEDQIKIGHTGTNVMDITMISIQSKI
ncbi:glycerate kinase [Cimex lectularius]|uniref:Glycerate kinase n=1 Tax=Cimex lectularius TaxID=79782 RepID=A0A8I6S540_CIMLE|nr:glycerate kinase [Cimex lectularius]